MSPIVARVYGPEALGRVTAAAVFAAMVATIAPLALDTAIVLVESDEEAAELAGLVIRSSIVVSILGAMVVVLAPMLAVHWKSLAFVGGSPLWWASFVMMNAMLTCVVQALTALSTRRQEFRRVTSSRVVQSVVTQGLTLGIGFFWPNELALAGAMAAGQLAGGSLLLGVALRPRMPAWQRTKALFLTYKRYPLYTYPNVLLDSARENAIIAGLAVVGGEVGLGYWALVSRTVRGPVLMVGSAFSQVFAARAAEALRNGQPLSPIMRFIGLRLAALSATAVTVLAIGGPYLFGFIFGPAWSESGELARLCVAWIALNLLTSPFAYLAFLLKLNRPFLGWALLYDLALIAVCSLAGPSLGLRAFVGAIAAVGGVLMFAMLAWLYRAGLRFDSAQGHPPSLASEQPASSEP